MPLAPLSRVSRWLLASTALMVAADSLAGEPAGVPAPPSRPWFAEVAHLPSPLAGERPAFAVLDARLASWDADAAADGWIATLRVLDDAGRPVAFFGNAVFELTPRVASADLSSYEAARERPLRWTTRVVTDEQGCARFRLPLRRSLPRTEQGWVPASGVLRVRVAIAAAGVFEAESAVALNPPGLLGTNWPESGSMELPAGALAPASLVDTLWNAR